MTAVQLHPKFVERVCGTKALPPMFPKAPTERKIGEIWFEHPTQSNPRLLIKYLFTSEPLSVQVHPGAGYAASQGYDRGKDEAWLLLDAEPGARLALGLKDALSVEELRAAAGDGSTEELLNFTHVRRDEIYQSPAGTIHAIGAGIALIDLQENLDITYRLYDYGRDRGTPARACPGSRRPTASTRHSRSSLPKQSAKQHLEGSDILTRSVVRRASCRSDRRGWPNDLGDPGCRRCSDRGAATASRVRLDIRPEKLEMEVGAELLIALPED